jgi:hypothetical protein
VSEIDRGIAELEATLKLMKKLRGHGNKGKRRSPEQRAKMSAARKAALADPAVRAKMSAARKAAWADPAVRAKMSAASKAAWADPAVRAKMSAASKAAWAEKYEADLAPKRKRETRKGLPPVPRDPFEALLFGDGAA